MPNHLSAMKRVRSDSKKNIRNVVVKSKCKTLVKNFLKSLEDQSVPTENKKKLLVMAESSLKKAVSKGILHINNASRRVSRMYAKLKKFL